LNDNFPPQARSDWRGDFVDVDNQPFVAPAQRAWPDGQGIGITLERRSPTLGHCPAVPACAVKRYVERNMIEWVIAPRPMIVRRKYAADKGDDG
jgi:hypothetical protein